MIPEPWKEGVWQRFPTRAELPLVSLSQHLGQCWVSCPFSVNCTFHQTYLPLRLSSLLSVLLIPAPSLLHGSTLAAWAFPLHCWPSFIFFRNSQFSKYEALSFEEPGSVLPSWEKFYSSISSFPCYEHLSPPHLPSNFQVKNLILSEVLHKNENTIPCLVIFQAHAHCERIPYNTILKAHTHT